MSQTPKEIAELSGGKLAQWLIEQARDARSYVLEDDFLALREVFTIVRGAAGMAKGTNRDLLEVAEAFFAPLARNQLSRQQIELRQFLRANGDAAEDFLRHLLDEKSISLEAPQVARLRAAISRLEELGVLLSQAGFFRIGPAAEPFVRELIDPLAFRLWGKVEQARREAAAAPEAQRALMLAGHLGVSEAQSRRFLSKHLPARRPAGRELNDFVVPRGGLVEQRSTFGETVSSTHTIGTVAGDDARASAQSQNVDREPRLPSLELFSS